MQIVNWGLVKHPLNWATIVLMLVIAAMAGTLVMQAFGKQPSGPDDGGQ